MCDTFVALKNSTGFGDIIFAKNSDREFYEAQYLQLIPGTRFKKNEKVKLTYVEIDQAASTHSILISKPHWIWGAEMGANEHGLVIGNEAHFSKVEASGEHGIIGMDLVRLALERTRSVDEAIFLITDLIRQYGQGGNCGYKESCLYHNSFMIADSEGASVLETVEREWAVRPAHDVDAISNALTIKSDFVTSSDTLKSFAARKGLNDPSHSFDFKSVFADEEESKFGEERRQRSCGILNSKQGSITVRDAFQLLRDHGEKGDQGYFEPRLCLHMEGSFLDATTASMVSSITSDKQVHWVTGTAAACTSIFKPVIIEAGLPEHGPTPGENDDRASLWWKHEAVRRYILGSNSNVVERFETERDRLENEFVELIETCPSPDTPDATEYCTGVVSSCWSRANIFEQRWYESAIRTGM